MEKKIEYALINNCTVYLHLINGETVSGRVEKSDDHCRVKLRNDEGVFWIPIEEIQRVFSVQK